MQDEKQKTKYATLTTEKAREKREGKKEKRETERDRGKNLFDYVFLFSKLTPTRASSKILTGSLSRRGRPARSKEQKKAL